MKVEDAKLRKQGATYGRIKGQFQNDGKGTSQNNI